MLLDADRLLGQLKKSGSRMRAIHEKHDLKSEAEFYGVALPVARLGKVPPCGPDQRRLRRGL